MTDIKYDLRYLPLFYEELEEKIIYISEKLKNPQAANTLLDAVEKAILERLPNAESFESYHSLKERKYPYYRIYVKNFVIFYVVIKDEGAKNIMEVRRILYHKQNRNPLI
ncbi:type II toxin-antitoxin system RelE/ParE family toxin [Ruminococcus gauvreauii]|uniref:Type II toxin-antitoxin system RelE/ParE family toxin n=1 Tax=Ruminococcus gauvreauii TaxID=438033 RepID=A0ABY5VL11_9FIRM|nr:type II toxin-antitoxin system RelE/ParE family toxin [Ruminococcus gauvreauii]UWP60997.1 type II toxin-antitoxin system RelE/ParE family toxin [Ruminococcus gauvreauii]